MKLQEVIPHIKEKDTIIFRDSYPAGVCLKYDSISKWFELCYIKESIYEVLHKGERLSADDVLAEDWNYLVIERF